MASIYKRKERRILIEGEERRLLKACKESISPYLYRKFRAFFSQKPL